VNHSGPAGLSAAPPRSATGAGSATRKSSCWPIAASRPRCRERTGSGRATVGTSVRAQFTGHRRFATQKAQTGRRDSEEGSDAGG
jgi:hypothetical protein